jgi:hypothetical protein
MSETITGGFVLCLLFGVLAVLGYLQHGLLGLITYPLAPVIGSVIGMGLAVLVLD